MHSFFVLKASSSPPRGAMIRASVKRPEAKQVATAPSKSPTMIARLSFSSEPSEDRVSGITAPDRLSGFGVVGLGWFLATGEGRLSKKESGSPSAGETVAPISAPSPIVASANCWATSSSLESLTGAGSKPSTPKSPFRASSANKFLRKVQVSCSSLSTPAAALTSQKLRRVALSAPLIASSNCTDLSTMSESVVTVLRETMGAFWSLPASP
mmetsp:Transcript_7098/g.43926  ORF Transcript_7098/g.43926 Transcript_7098/m.43926 type:complete len:212 (-) Transcript_7098:1375-2010(-)